MGACESACAAQPEVGGQAPKYADQLDQQIAKEKEEEKNHFKILLLGAGESGKSTIIKQLSLLYRKGGIMEDRRQFVRVLQNNTIICMQALLRAAEQFEYDQKSDGEWQSDSSLIMGTEGNDAMTEPMAEAIQRLWASEGVQKTYLHRNHFWILETADYYFDNCMRFVEDGFMPNDVDVIMARKRTTGVIVTEFPADGIKFSVVDVGGQRSERRKWINCVPSGQVVTLQHGLGRKIEDFADAKYADDDAAARILTYDMQRGGVKVGPVSHHIPQGLSELVKRGTPEHLLPSNRVMRLRLYDGRELLLTAEHPVLVDRADPADNKRKPTWVPAGDLNAKDSVHCTTQAPLAPVTSDPTESQGHSLAAGAFTFSTDNLQQYETFARLLAFAMAGGSLCESFFGHRIDAEEFAQDVKLLTGSAPEVSLRAGTAGTYAVALPTALTEAFVSLKGIVVDSTAHSLPAFVMEASCPVTVVREFICGLQGRAGLVPQLQRESRTRVKQAKHTAAAGRGDIAEDEQPEMDLCADAEDENDEVSGRSDVVIPGGRGTFVNEHGDEVFVRQLLRYHSGFFRATAPMARKATLKTMAEGLQALFARLGLPKPAVKQCAVHSSDSAAAPAAKKTVALAEGKAEPAPQPEAKEASHADSAEDATDGTVVTLLQYTRHEDQAALARTLGYRYSSHKQRRLDLFRAYVGMRARALTTQGDGARDFEESCPPEKFLADVGGLEAFTTHADFFPLDGVVASAADAAEAEAMRTDEDTAAVLDDGTSASGAGACRCITCRPGLHVALRQLGKRARACAVPRHCEAVESMKLPVRSVETVYDQQFELHDLHVEGTNNFVVEGCVVHNCFEGVKAIFWVSNLAGYDKVLFEDKTINRMHEDIDLFKETLKAPTFKATPVFLFFNKKDLFDLALQSSNIDLCFPEYKGKQEPDEAQDFIAQQFRDALPPGKTIEMITFLSAKKKEEVRSAFEAVKDHLIAMYSGGGGGGGGGGRRK